MILLQVGNVAIHLLHLTFYSGQTTIKPHKPLVQSVEASSEPVFFHGSALFMVIRPCLLQIGTLLISQKRGVIQKCHRLCLSSMLPHQREKPDPTLPDTEIRWGERHLRIEWGIGSLWMVLSRPSKGLTFPRLPLGMKANGKGPDGIQVRNGHRHNGRMFVVERFYSDSNGFHVSVAPFAMPR
jgi:hypothetical protein